MVGLIIHGGITWRATFFKFPPTCRTGVYPVYDELRQFLLPSEFVRYFLMMDYTYIHQRLLPTHAQRYLCNRKSVHLSIFTS